MRKPSEYLPSAYARLQRGTLADCAETLRWGDVSATITRIGSPTRGEDAVYDSDIPERRRVLAPVSPFAGLEKGCAVELDGTFRIVTSCTDNIAKAAFFTVGLSDSFDKCLASCTGTRRERGRVRTFKFSLRVLALDGGTEDAYSDTPAQSSVRSYTVAVRRADWPEVSAPEVSDAMTISPDERPQIDVKVAAVTRNDGWYILKCRTR